MIRRILLISFLFCGLWACEDDDVVFDAPVPEEGMRFEPVPGGAVMYYTLPDDSDVAAVYARYVNERGEEVKVAGTPFVDSIALTGFHAPHTDVPVRITVADNNDVESAPVELTFSTLASCPYAFIDSVEVVSSWNGFLMRYNYSGTPSGIVDIYRVGVNPYTQEIDTLYMDNMTIASGEQSSYITLETDDELTTIVLRTEDGQGNFVRTAVFPDLSQHKMAQYPSGNLALSDPGNFSFEDEGTPDPITALGIKYLTDGDTKGANLAGQDPLQRYCTYVTNGDGRGSYVQVELADPQVIASVRIYAIIEGSPLDGFTLTAPPFNMNYRDFLPSHVRVLASNDPSLPTEEWVQLGEMYQNPNVETGSWMEYDPTPVNDPAEFDNLEPRSVDVTCDYSETEYKYLRVVSDDHFNTTPGMFGNTVHYISYHELEVYVKAD